MPPNVGDFLPPRNVAIEHLTLQADVVYRLADTRLVIRTPNGMGLAKTSLMVRRVVPEYRYIPSDNNTSNTMQVQCISNHNLIPHKDHNTTIVLSITLVTLIFGLS